MSLNNESYGYLLSPHIQIMDHNGNPMTGAFLKVFEAGSSYTQVTTYSDWEGTPQEANKELDARGEVVIIASKSITYKVMLCDYTRGVDNPYWVLNNVSIESSSVLPGNVVVQVNGTTGEIDSTLTLDEEGNKVYTESLSSTIKTTIATNTSDITNIETHITEINNDLGDIDNLLNTLIPGEKSARAFPLSLTNTRYLKICDVDTDGTIPYHLDFLLYLAKSQLSLKFDEDVQGLMGTGTGSFKYLGQSCNSVFVYDVTPNTGRLVIFRTTPVDGKVSFYLVSYNGYELTNETVSIIDGHISGTTAVFSADAYTETAPTMGSNSETIYLTHNIRVGTSCSGLGTYYSPIEAKATQVISSDETVDVTTTVVDGVTTHDLAVAGGQVDTFKFKIDAIDQQAKFANDKLQAGGLTTKSIEAAGSPGDWYEALKFTTTLYTDGTTCSGAGTSEDPLVAKSEVAHIATGDSIGAKDIIQLQAGSSTQWSAHAAMCSTIGAITPSALSKLGFIATQVATGNFIIAAYKVETSLNHSLICATGVNSIPSFAGWISADIANVVKAIAANDRVYLVLLTDSNGNAMAGASCTDFNIQPYVAGIKTNMGVLTEAPATLTFDSETTSRPFIYMVK